MVSHVYDSTLFDHLDSTWRFQEGPVPNSCWLDFNVDFAFKSPLYRHIALVFFDEVGSAFVVLHISRHEGEVMLVQTCAMELDLGSTCCFSNVLRLGAMSWLPVWPVSMLYLDFTL